MKNFKKPEDTVHLADIFIELRRDRDAFYYWSDKDKTTAFHEAQFAFEHWLALQAQRVRKAISNTPNAVIYLAEDNAGTITVSPEVLNHIPLEMLHKGSFFARYDSLAHLSDWHGAEIYLPPALVEAVWKEFPRPSQSAGEGVSQVGCGLSPAEVTSQIVKAFDVGERFAKKDAKIRFADPLSYRQFDKAWAKAAELRPELSRPGRRSGS